MPEVINMKNKQDIFKKEKGAAVGLVVCFVAMIAIVGLITFSQYQRRTDLEQQQLAETETKDATEDKKPEEKEPSQTTNTDSIQAEIQKPVVTPSKETPVAPSVTSQPTLKFAANDVLMWPVEGNVVLSYSMDKPVYFSTLDQYKYNPAMIISGEVGAEVLAAAEGKVTSIETNAQTGTTLTMDIGSGFEIVYGQLKDVCVAEGYRVSEGDVIGYVNEPTKYYSVEGPNLYFQLLKDGEPVNPLEYLDA